MKKYSLSTLYRAGLINEKPKMYIDIANKVEELKSLHVKKPKSKVANDMKISVRTVTRACQAKKNLLKAERQIKDR